MKILMILICLIFAACSTKKRFYHDKKYACYETCKEAYTQYKETKEIPLERDIVGYTVLKELDIIECHCKKYDFSEKAKEEEKPNYDIKDIIKN